ncbi:MAG: ABC transporter permease subunit [Acidilobaceae archaeon]
MSSLRAVFVKEVKSLLRDRYVLFSVILAPFLALMVIGLIAILAFQGMAQQIEELESRGLPKDTFVCLEDQHDELALKLVYFLNAEVVDCDTANYRALIIVHKGFGEALRSGAPGLATIRIAVDNPLSIVSMTLMSRVDQEVKLATTKLISDLYGINATFLKSPVITVLEMRLHDKTLVESSQLALSYIYLGALIAVLALATTSMQVGALGVGIEREAKTIESLLVMPLPLWKVVVGKTGGAAIVSVLSLISLICGLFVYLYGVSRAFPAVLAGETVSINELISTSLEQLGVGAVNLALALASLALIVVLSSLIGVVLGAFFAGDVRGALTTGSYAGIAMVAPLFPIVLGYEPQPLTEALFALSPVYLPARAMILFLSGSLFEALPYMLFSFAHIPIAIALVSFAFRPAVIVSGVKGLISELRIYKKMKK